MTQNTRENEGGGAGKAWCYDYGEVALYLSVRKGEIHEYVTREDLDTARPDENGNVTIFIHEGAYVPEDYDHYNDFSYAHYAHTRRYEVTMPIDVLRDRAMRGVAAVSSGLPGAYAPKSLPFTSYLAAREQAGSHEGGGRG